MKSVVCTRKSGHGLYVIFFYHITILHVTCRTCRTSIHVASLSPFRFSVPFSQCFVLSPRFVPIPQPSVLILYSVRVLYPVRSPPFILTGFRSRWGCALRGNFVQLLSAGTTSLIRIFVFFSVNSFKRAGVYIYIYIYI